MFRDQVLRGGIGRHVRQQVLHLDQIGFDLDNWNMLTAIRPQPLTGGTPVYGRFDLQS